MTKPRKAKVVAAPGIGELRRVAAAVERRWSGPPPRKWIMWLAGALAVAIIGAFFLWRSVSGAGVMQQPWFSGYVDVTVDPQYEFGKPNSAQTRNVTLAFIVADATQPCTPSWGSSYSLDSADDALNIGKRISSLRSSGGAIAVSFGGSINTELSVACQDPDALLKAYRTVVERYSPSTIDFDVEGDALLNAQAGQRRATAVAELQKERGQWGEPLDVWLTLPVSPHGLTDDGIAAVDQMLAAGVRLAGVNIMTMNYGSSRAAGQSMLNAAIAAAEAAHDQLSIAYQRAGTSLSAQEIWNRMGLTPMIGVNDLPDEVFGLDDAQGLNSFAAHKGIQRVSMWSLNRDQACDSGMTGGTASHICSGLQQQTGEFSRLLGEGFDGRLR